MAVIHVTEAEAARDLHALLEKASEGMEIEIESAGGFFKLASVEPREEILFTARHTAPRRASEVLADMEKNASNALLDPGFSEHLQTVIDEGQRETWTKF